MSPSLEKARKVRNVTGSNSDAIRYLNRIIEIKRADLDCVIPGSRLDIQWRAYIALCTDAIAHLETDALDAI